MYLPESTRAILGNRAFILDQTGLSGAMVICYDDMVLKAELQNEESDNEVRMMQWLRGRVGVPEIIHREVFDGRSYLLMSRLPGRMSCDSCWKADPRRLAEQLAQGLYALWSIDPQGCPCDQRLETKLRRAEYLVEHGLCDMEHVQPETYGKEGFASPAHLLSWLRENCPAEEQVISHGDFCMPNVFLDNWRLSGFLDLGRAGVADPYQDIALCWRSLRDNFGGQYGEGHPDFYPELLFDVLGICPEWEKIRYYLLLDELF